MTIESKEQSRLWHAFLALDPKTKRGKLTEPIPSQYESLLREIKERIRSAQLAALRQVNHEMITLYSDIGRLIVARQRRHVGKIRRGEPCKGSTCRISRCQGLFSSQPLANEALL